MDGSPRSLQTHKRPPGSKEKYRGLNPSLLGTRSESNFALKKKTNIRFSFLFLGFRNGKWTPGRIHDGGNNHII